MRLVLALAAFALLTSFASVRADPNRIAFPQTYRTSFVHYAVSDRSDLGQVRHLYANPIAVAAMRDGNLLPHGAVLVAEIFAVLTDPGGRPLPSVDGGPRAGELLSVAVMESGPGWGDEHPREIRNGDWNYAMFDGVTKRVDLGRSERGCLACHKPMASTQFLFSYDDLAAKVGGAQRLTIDPTLASRARAKSTPMN
jgi:hypothetical protein